MNMEKYSRSVDDFAAANCNVGEEDIMEKVQQTKKRRLKSIIAFAACVTFFFVGTTVSAATGRIDLKGLFKKLFSDEITGNLIEEGAIQEVDITAQSGNYTLTFEGVTGDSNTQFGVFKLVDHTGELGSPSLLQVDVRMAGVSVLEEGRLSEYASCSNDSFTVLEEEENAFYIKVRVPVHWANAKEDIFISLKGVTAYYGEVEFFRNTRSVAKADRIVEIPFDFEGTFTTDIDALPKSSGLAIEETITSEFGDFTVKLLDASRYTTQLIITFPTNEDISDVNDATSLWHRFDNDYIYEYECDIVPGESWPETDAGYRLLNVNGKGIIKNRLFKTVEDPSGYTEGDIKLYVDGVEIKRTVNTSYKWASAMDSTENPTVWGNLISFDPIDLSAADTIEIRYKDQSIRVK